MQHKCYQPKISLCLSLTRHFDRWMEFNRPSLLEKKIFKAISYHLFNKTIFVYVNMSTEVKVWDKSLLHKLGREINMSKPIRRSYVYPVKKWNEICKVVRTLIYRVNHVSLLVLHLNI